jgi:hypothetical protein
MRTYSRIEVKHFRLREREIHHSTRDMCNDFPLHNAARIAQL